MRNDAEGRKAARDVLNAVREIFARWDSGDVLSAAEGRNEERLSEECIANIATLVLKNGSVPEVAKLLDRVVSKSVGLVSDSGRNREFAEQFVAAGRGQRLR